MTVNVSSSTSKRVDRGTLILPIGEVVALFALGVVLFVVVPGPLWRAAREESHLWRFLVSYFAIVPVAAWRLRAHRALDLGALATVVGVVWAAKLLATVPLYHLFATSRRPDVHAPEVAATTSAPSVTHLVEPSPGVIIGGRVTDHGAGVDAIVALCDDGLVADVAKGEHELHVSNGRVAPRTLDLSRGDALVIVADDARTHDLRGLVDGVAAFNLPVVSHARSREIVHDVGALALELDGSTIGWAFSFDHPWHAHAAADGRFTLVDAPLGAHRLCVFRDGPKPALVRDVVVPSSGLDLTLLLEGSPS